MADEGFKRKLPAILSSDAVVCSRLIKDDDEVTIQTLTLYRETKKYLIQQHQGRIIDWLGKKSLAEFT